MEALGDRLADDGGTVAVLTRVASAIGGASNTALLDGGLNVIPPRESIPMEALGDRLTRNGGGNTAVPTADAGLAAVIASVNAAAASAPGTLAMAGYVEASDFAGLVEELSRSLSSSLCK